MYKIDKKDREQVIIIINDYTFLYERAMANGKEVHIYGIEEKNKLHNRIQTSLTYIFL